MSSITTSDPDLEIPYYEIPPSYDDFLKNHLIPNKPCVIGPALTENWKARKEWVVPTGHEYPKYKPNYTYLRDHYGTAKGMVAKCSKRHFSDQYRTPMSFADFTDLWEADDGKPSQYYLKDLHLAKTFPQDIFYQVPDLFEDDWLNEYWLASSDDDYRFAYLGGDHTFTPLHADVYRSYSWSSNICGVKKWTLFPPNQEALFQDKYGNMVYDIRCVDKEQFPNFEQARSIDLYQKDGETVFVPSGWFHQVVNIGAAISINHNWSNASNLVYTYQSLKKDLNDCQAAIEDVRDSMTAVEFVMECQKLLLVHSGWDWRIFLSILCCIVSHRFNRCAPKNQPEIKWQMEQIEAVLTQWKSDEGDDLITYFKSQDDLYAKYQDLVATISTLKQ